jgi:transcriptional regulator with XRE-family HTH domain
MSQLDLALVANVSARHLSFLETGRARPSRGMVLTLCRELAVPRAARNRMLSAAGHAPIYGERPLEAAEMAPVRAAVDWMLDRHAPYPAFALDRHWHLVALNGPATALLGAVGIEAGESLAEALAQNARLRAAIENLDEVLAVVASRIRTESAHYGGDPELERVAARLSVGLPPAAPDAPPLPPFVATRLQAGGERFSLLSTIAQFGGAEDIALADLRVEMLFPADAATRDTLARLAGP